MIPARRADRNRRTTIQATAYNDESILRMIGALGITRPIDGSVPLMDQPLTLSTPLSPRRDPLQICSKLLGMNWRSIEFE